MIYDITASIVLYNNERGLLLKTIHSFLNTSLNVKLYLVDNSPTNDLMELSLINEKKIEYIHNPSNPGFGAGHNIALKKVIKESPYHILLNPDIFFNSGVNENIKVYLDQNDDIGVLMPKIVYPDNSIQYLAKLLPTPFDFIIRRLIPIQKLKDKINNRFEMRVFNYEKIIEVPFLSGCYLFVKTEALKKSGLFDENYFMYCEDIDFCRNMIDCGYKSIFYPKVSVIHAHERKSFKDRRVLMTYFKSMIYYFNKWGWFFDEKRKRINREALKQIGK